MYKTVRHGENSLQYTILPQQDDLSVTGPQKGAPGGICRGRQQRRRGRTTTILVVTLLLVCSIVAGTVLVPLLLTTDIIAFRKLQSANLASNHIIHHHAKVSRHLEPLALPTTTPTTTTTTMTTTTTTSPTSTTPDENLNTVTTGANVQEQSINSTTGRSYLDSGIDIVNMTVEADTTLSATTEKADASSEESTKIKNDTEELVDNNSTMLVTLLKGITSTRLVVQAPVATQVRHKAPTTTETSTEVRASSRPTVDPYRGWLPPRWPFADPSSYLQWTGYSGTHDSLLLPLLLGLVLFVLVLSVVFCYCMRRRHQTFLRREAIGKMASDLRSDESADKASLLPDNSEEE